MKVFALVAFLPALLVDSVSGAKFSLSSLRGAKTLPNNVVPNRFVIEVDSPTDISSKRDVSSREVSSPHTYVLSSSS